MRYPLSLLFGLALIGTSCGPSNQPPAASVSTASSPSFDEWADAFAKEWARNSPQLATRTQYFTGDEQDALDGLLTLIGEWGDTFGVAAAKQRAELGARGLEQLRTFNRDRLTPQQKVSAAVIQWSLESAVKNAEFATYK